MIKRLVKLKLSLALHAVDALRRLFQAGARDRCVVLYYHGVTDAQRHRFHRQMRWLASHRRVVPVAQARSGNLAGTSCCVTFDDALDSVRVNALPICRELNLPFSVYAVTGNFGDRPRWAMPPGHPDAHEPIMTEAQLRALPPDLVTIGSHTVTHRPLGSLTKTQIAEELRESKRQLEEGLGRSVGELSVPYGSFREDVLREARRCGYELVLTCEPEVLHPPHQKPSAGRFKVTPDDWMIEFRLAAAGAYRWRQWLRRRRSDECPDAAKEPVSSTDAAEPAR